MEKEREAREKSMKERKIRETGERRRAKRETIKNFEELNAAVESCFLPPAANSTRSV